MAKKFVTLRALARIDYNGGTYCPGTDEDTFECDLGEAKRLKDMGIAVAAEVVVKAAASAAASIADQLAKIAAATTIEELNAIAIAADGVLEVFEAAHRRGKEMLAQAQTDLLAQVAAATTREDLEALIPEEEPSDPDFALELRAAFTARLTELAD